MSRPAAPIVCDGPGCQKHKQEANHWWTITQHTAPGHLSIQAGTTGNPDALPGTYFDACGQDCALKIVSEQMGKVSQ